MCLTLPRVLVSLMGIEKVLPRLQDLEVFLQLLPRAATGERMNPYTSLWTGVREGDGPQEFHLVLLDNGRSRILADPVARETLHCIRCSRCLNVCPVYERTGGHAYDSMYQGPIGAILTPQLRGMKEAGSLPFASSLCGACYEVCPVKIDIPRILVHLRGKATDERRGRTSLDGEALAMRAALWVFGGATRMRLAQGAARIGQKLFAREGVIEKLPGPLAAWSASRDFPAIPAESFRNWWKRRLSARDEIIGRIRAAQSNLPAPTQHEPAFRRHWDAERPEILERFVQRLSDYHVTVLHAPTEAHIASVAERQLASRGIASLVIPADLPAGWRPSHPAPIEDIGPGLRGPRRGRRGDDRQPARHRRDRHGGSECRRRAGSAGTDAAARLSSMRRAGGPCGWHHAGSDCGPGGGQRGARFAHYVFSRGLRRLLISSLIESRACMGRGLWM